MNWVIKGNAFRLFSVAIATNALVSKPFSGRQIRVPVTLASTAAAIEDDVKSHSHEFWGQKRSHYEIKSHLDESLENVGSTDDAVARVEVLSADPPLVVIHEFLSDSMCDEIIQVSTDTGNMQRSQVGATQTTQETRSSSTCWLKDHECEDPLRLISEKVSRIVGLPVFHQENLQVVRYEPGQEFKLHTDHQDNFNDLECKGRLATCLVYLAEPGQGGETWFPGLVGDDIDITPCKGSAIFFWNTVEKPGSDGYHPEMFLNTDMRMAHSGRAVDSGSKWVCNKWIHPIDFGAGIRGL